MRHFLTALTLALVAACAPAPAPATTTDQWADAPMSAPPAQPDTEEARSCAARGGACRDGDDCQGDCRADAGATGQVTGQCQASSDPCGCFAVVEDGRVQHALCVD